MNLAAGRGVAVREFKMASGHGFADYLLFVDGKAVGALEAKPVGYPLINVELQVDKYAHGLPAGLNPPVDPLPFQYISTGVETRFINGLDPDPKTRAISANLPQIHRPETLAEWISAETLDQWVKRLHAEGTGLYTAADDTKPSSFRARLQTMPPLERGTLFKNQFEAVTNLEHSMKRSRPRALIQMATGSGKTIAAITAIYRLIKYGGARRVLFLVDRSNLGEQAETEFQGYRAPDGNRLFTELYNVQRLASNNIMDSSRVVIATIQRVYSMLKGEELDPLAEEVSQFESSGAAMKEPLPVVYNERYPPEFFDVVVIDEVHRSIYTLWRQVVEYFDAFLIGLTATPSKQTLGFFNKNLVMEYDHERAVADGVNVDFEVYNIRTQITAQGSTVEATPDTMLGYRHKQTRATRWETPDEDLTYDPNELDRKVVAKDQIRTIVRTFRDRLPVDIFPGRKEVPKTLIFAKDDSHAEDIVEIIRDEFGRGNSFCQKITYKVTSANPRDLIQAFRNQYEPRIAVTVDMVATGTDIKPVEIVMFMRAVKSRVLFEQMKGRGVRVIDPNDLQAVSGAHARAKTHFVIVDCVGMTETQLADTQPLERKRSVALGTLLEHVAMGGTDPEMLSSLASRLSRLDKECGPKEHARITEVSGGVALSDISHGIVEGLDPDRQLAEAHRMFGVPEAEEPTDAQVRNAAETLLKAATVPLATSPALRMLLADLKRELEQVIDEVSQDELLEAGASEEAKEKAKALVTSFEQFIEENRDEIEALQFFYAQPHSRRLTFRDIKELAAAIKAPPRSWTPEKLWRAYETLRKDRVRGASGQRLLTDIVSLVRFAVHKDDELVPFGEQVRERFEQWLAQQRDAGHAFTPEQRRWLEMMRDHIATSLEMTVEDFDLAPFVEEGGLGRAAQVFGGELRRVLDELNGALAA
ncbi:MAG TPA: type I restriction-modification enzyme R subunit C-terminal domain-containing protein [Thermoanaerobaculia bacterium]|nr:type I restriction-modification enzyme R subunit C-terminal domain-containing protein [Thermoanaerobaculia bacterium]